ncbi:LuxR C-terminal-related transcriptional regulator [Streptomyces iakyrus]|uniref:LuxR C-terminal-related transcriptional regulator n=1 Tax=Streptomyces iakyrus TaxID=68219 RepID=UPI0005269C03|nr:LuxR C-terminal-related transcriptional regulator [Streptomyces iakyrus]
MSRSRHGFSDRDLEYAGLVSSLLDTVSAHECVSLRKPSLSKPGASEGLTAHAIGSRLRITEKTVVKHKENLCKKLRVHDRVTAINKARFLGLISPEPPVG